MDKTVENIFAGIPWNLPDEMSETLLQATNFRMERIISRGHVSPEGFWYEQAQAEWVMVIRGGAGLQFEESGRIMEMGPGDHVNIPARCRHRVAWTAPDVETVWLAIHYDGENLLK